MHFGFFDEWDRNYSSHGVIEDGVNGVVKQAGSTVEVEFGGHRREFTLDQSWKSQAGLKLLDNEELVSGVLDESGYFFFLAFDEKAKQFVFLRNQTTELPEKRVKMEF